MNNFPLHFTAYLGLFATQLLAVACNAFLDIQYGSFPREMIFWAIVFGLTLLIGVRQRHKLTGAGKVWQKGVLIFGLLLFFVVFLRICNLPRAGLYLLAMLQASYNCVVRSKSELNLSLAVSLALVMFATSHYRADWTMLFYLAPYVVAVVFTLVAEQIHNRSDKLNRVSLARPSNRGQGMAILAATAAILSLGGLLYLATPQVTWPYLQWRYGQLVDLEPGGQNELPANSGADASDPPEEGDDAGQTPDTGNDRGGAEWRQFPENHWPTPEEMRAAAKRPNMPVWQARTIEKLADISENVQRNYGPIAVRILDLWDALKRWLAQHWLAVLLGILALMILSLVVAFAALLSEVPLIAWLLTHWDYLNLVILDNRTKGVRGASQYYRAMTRLFTLQGISRPKELNTQEYLYRIARRHKACQRDALELTLLFEQARYGPNSASAEPADRMREAYRKIFRRISH